MNDSVLHTIGQTEAFLTGTATVKVRLENTAPPDMPSGVGIISCE